jgi:hypothetical protein
LAFIALRRNPDGGDDGDGIGADDGVEQGGVDALGVADEAQVDHPLDVGIGIAAGARELPCKAQVAVLARDADGAAAGALDVGDDALVDGAGEHHLDDLDRCRIGDSQAAGELRLDAEPVQHRRDLRAATMHHHRIDRGLFQQHDVAGEHARGFLLAHGVAAIFDHDDLVVIALHVRQRLRENPGLVVRGDRHAGSPWRGSPDRRMSRELLAGRPGLGKG